VKVSPTMTPQTRASGQRLGLRILALTGLATVALITLPGVHLRQPILATGGKTLSIVLFLALQFIVAATLLLVRKRRGESTEAVSIIVATCAAAALPLLAIVVAHPGFPASYLLLAGPLFAALLWLLVHAAGHPRLAGTLIGAAAAAGIALQAAFSGGLLSRPPPAPSASTRQVITSLYTLDVTFYRNFIPRPETNQGGITPIGDQYLLGTGSGDLYVFSRQDGKLSRRKLAYRVPLNDDEFARADGPGMNPVWFRVADVLYVGDGAEGRLYASHHFWRPAERCVTMRLSMLQGSPEEILSGSAKADWTTVFESHPCMTIGGENMPTLFGGINNGGRISAFGNDRLLLTIGDHEIDGWRHTEAASQNPASSYGKLVLIDPQTHGSEIFSLGLRSPQGLIVTRGGEIWTTEHGPQGGDELNLIKRGANYGWPLATYGTEYGTHAWPLTSAPGVHAGFEQPYFSWVPSIGVSSLVEITSPRFRHWEGDLLVGALRGEKLTRIRVRDSRVVMAEEIAIGERIRDVLQGHDGELVLWTDAESLVFITPSGDARSGELLFAACAMCHAVTDRQRRLGPNLQGIVGRPVAAVEDFPYSPAMKAMGGNWTRERLDEFLEDPTHVVPGTSMQFMGMKDEESREKLIEFLESPESRLDVMPDRGDI